MKNRLPFAPIYTDPVQQKLVSPAMADDGNTSVTLTEVHMLCNEKCYAIDCEQTMYITSLVGDYYNPDLTGLSFAVMMKSRPRMTVTATITNDFFLFLNNFLGVFGTWFDWDFLTIAYLAQILLLICSKLDWIGEEPTRRERVNMINIF